MKKMSDGASSHLQESRAVDHGFRQWLTHTSLLPHSAHTTSGADQEAGMVNDIKPSTIVTDEDLAQVTGGSSGTPGIGFMDATNMDLDQILALVQQQRQDQLDSSVQQQMDAIEQRNTQLTQMNGTLQELSGLDETLDRQGPLSTDTLVHHLGQETTLGALAADLGLDQERIDDGSIDASDMDAITGLLQDRIGDVTAVQTMEMAALQAMNEKRAEAMALMQQFIDRMQNTANNIIGNMR
ncbi:hypothetical protein P7L68_15240 [Tistrella mobilis]|uniref:hypothetical protein n=1 Tax=Tistrella mobilis TaxID=171437 RepID=UPI003558BB42